MSVVMKPFSSLKIAPLSGWAAVPPMSLTNFGWVSIRSVPVPGVSS